jgi:peptidoglycan hydrolase-like protein with peptidoglycan-binding domain
MKLGSSGPDVVRWQQSLIVRGYLLGLNAADGDFGKRTHNATCAFQAATGLEVTGEVTVLELQLMAAPRSPSIRPPPVLARTIPFVQSRFYGKRRTVVDLVVLHCMEGAESSTRAEHCAQYMAALSPDAGAKSAHYYVDSDSVVQGVPDHVVAFAAPGANHNGLQIEHAGYARQSTAEWLDDFGVRMLWLSAQLVARKARERSLPIRFVRAADLLKKGARGITTHHEVSIAFGRSDHHDPGPGFPMTWYLEQVQLAFDSQAAIV